MGEVGRKPKTPRGIRSQPVDYRIVFFAFVGHIYLQHRLLPWNFTKGLDKHKLERYNIGALEKVSSSYRGVEQFGSSSGS